MTLYAVFMPQTLNAGFCDPIVREVVGSDPYSGPYEVTPSEETQTLETSLKTAMRDIIINPIPTNYGRVTWNGSVLTVS